MPVLVGPAHPPRPPPTLFDGIAPANRVGAKTVLDA